LTFLKICVSIISRKKNGLIVDNLIITLERDVDYVGF